MGQLTVALADKLGIGGDEPCLDFGAGTGMMVRICRDYGMNYHYYDRYASNVFAIGFEADRLPAGTKPRMITAFEVAEHFPDPMTDFKEIFAFDPEYVFFSTCLYTGQDPDWWYFLDDGQHVAFYTEESLRRLGQAFGYHFCSDYDIHLFSKEPTSKRLLKKIRRSSAKRCKRYRKQFGSRTIPDAEFAREHLV
ncbi:class I SAM-dependent methyltransferase [Ruficoccus sp. ZRK36]|uniref:class I SAM-dependent methyltransferase n=1 Tax=Ruficoccus sp. ZRK36 TaxID=2866311 RepID=UPI001C7330A8|nr:class I SAM-dependent methyltransferase [Ruficoccus sp. ZRK36]QYY37393.1 class I SAM-dependent methyltransferase [Ruficoccus sp. ZRK36]